MTRDDITKLLEQGKTAANHGDARAAIAAWTQILPFQRNNHTLYAGLGNCYLELHRWDQAIAHYRVAVNMRPSFIPAIIGYADSLALGGKPEKALVHLHKSKKYLHPGTQDWGWYLGCKGTCHKALGHYTRAAELYAEALSLAPQVASLWTAAANLSYLEGNEDEAGMAYERAYALDQSFYCSNNLSSYYMAVGKWADAWRIHEERLKRPNSPVGVPGRPWWNGNRFQGRLAVFTEQGYGDFIMFARYLEPLKWRVTKPTLVVAPPQLELARAMNLGIPITDNIGAFEFDAQCALMSLPYLLEIPDPRQAPSPPPLVVSPVYSDQQPAVCLTWTGNPENPNANVRNLPLRLFAPLVRGAPHIHWFTCTPDKGVAEDIKRLKLPITQYLGGWLETAQRLAGADLMISVETGVTHLAGTLGLPTWTLLASFHDWRWGYTLGPDEPVWYRNMRLIRQEKAQSWESVLKDVAGRLHREYPARPLSTPAPALT